MNQYFLLRHGETVYQIKKKGFTYPWPDIPPVKLTKGGEKEIKDITKKLKKAKINLIYSSDIFRAKRTAEIVGKELGLKINFDERLRDTNLGIYHGKPKAEFYQDFPDPKKRFQKRPKKGESWNDIKKRIRSFIKDIEKKYQNKNILIVSHGDPLWLFEGIIKKLNNQELLDEIFVHPVRGQQALAKAQRKQTSNGVKKNYIQVGELRIL